MILAGDIGGTKTVLTLTVRQPDGSFTPHKQETFASSEFPAFESLLDIFLPAGQKVAAACFGVAGPVIQQRCRTTNLPWQLDARALSIRLGTPHVRLLNDLEAMALGMLELDDSELLELNPNAEIVPGNRAVIAAGTGLGEAILYWDDTRYHPMATEGGHADLAAQSPRQDGLLRHLRQLYPEHVSVERVLSGNGFSLIYDYLVECQARPRCPAVLRLTLGPSGDRNAVISRLGVNDEDATCRETVRLFVEMYAAEAGNLALRSLATGGVYIGGGIGPKIASMLTTGEFMGAFSAKGRFRAMLERVPVRLALNPRTPLLGAIQYAGSMVKPIADGKAG